MPRKIKAASPKARTKSQSRRLKVQASESLSKYPECLQPIVAALDQALNETAHVAKYPSGLKRNDVTAGPLLDDWIDPDFVDADDVSEGDEDA